MSIERLDLETQYGRILIELSDLGLDTVVWIGDVWFRSNTYTEADTFTFFQHAWQQSLRVRVHATEESDVFAYEAEFQEETGRFHWLPAVAVTPGPQAAKSHPVYQILDDFARIRGNRSCLVNLRNGTGVVLRQYNGRLSMHVATSAFVTSSEGGLFNDEVYELVGIAARIGGSFLVHVYGENEHHRVYLATTDNSIGAVWRPEEEVFEAFNIHNELVRTRFQIPETEIDRLNSMFTPSYFQFDYPKDGEHVRSIPNR